MMYDLWELICEVKSLNLIDIKQSAVERKSETYST